MLWCCAWSRILTTSMGVTTATASVMPAASPAGRSDQKLNGNERDEGWKGSFTKKGGLAADSAGCFIGQLLLIPFIRGETNCHFGHDAGDDCPKPFVKTQRGFPLDYLPASHEKPVAFGLLTNKMSNFTRSHR